MTAVSNHQSAPLGPLGYRGLRGAILTELKKAKRLTTRELAARLGVALNSVRHHLKDLEQQQLVEYEREHRGVGAPTFAYRLTGAGQALFPRQYEGILTSLLDDLVSRLGRSSAVEMLESRYSALAQRLQNELVDATPAQRLEAITQLLSQDGFMAESTLVDSIGTLTEHNCAIQSVAERFPEICAAEARFLGEVLGGSVRRERHILNGCSACEYHLRLTPENSASGPPAPLPDSVVSTSQENS